VLVERGAVEPRQPVGVLREVARHPVEDDADAGAVAASTNALKSSGVPKRLVGAKKPMTW
jgi:hypothetical protein